MFAAPASLLDLGIDMLHIVVVHLVAPSFVKAASQVHVVVNFEKGEMAISAR